MRRWMWVLLLCACDGGGGTDAGTDAADDAGPTCTETRFGAAGNLDRWPEPTLVVPDATTETGVRLSFDEAQFPELTSVLRGYREVFTEDLEELDGFGVSAEAFFRFQRAFDVGRLPSVGETVAPNAGMGMAVLQAGGATLVEVQVDTTDEGQTLLMAPQRPLPARVEAVAFVTVALTEAAGGCLQPSPAMRDVIEGTPVETIEALVAAGAIASADDLVAISVFATQSIEEDTIAVAEDIAARGAPAFVAPPTCVDEAVWRRCEAAYVAHDYRDEDGVFRRDGGAAAVSRATYEVPVTFWLPLEGEAPYPTLFFGHGLSGDRGQARRLAEFAAPAGLATVASPALMHGAHPSNPDPDAEGLNVVLDFFAVGDPLDRALHATRLREHFRQTTWDRLQLTELLATSPDVNGDGEPDVDGEQLMYLGVSLGGLMGPELLAATDRYGAGVLVVPGGRVSTIISDSPLFGALIDLLRPRRATEGDVRRFFPVLQTILDAGDAASYGPHVLGQRFERAPEVPDVLVGVVLDDEIVPNIANYAIGRALDVPIVEPVLRETPGFEVVTGPVRGNVAGGATAGLLQFDRVQNDERAVVPATHNNIGDSDVGAGAWLDFLTSHLAGDTVVQDPYRAFPDP
ncbi:MAG: hypothetical protein AB8I08_22855 [Sandaracinaceae bacterium]